MLFIIFFFIKNPDKKPIIPQLNICHGVQGPCPKNKFDARAAIVPVKNPASGPNTLAVIIIIADVGLKNGTGANATLPTAARAAITAKGIHSLA